MKKARLKKNKLIPHLQLFCKELGIDHSGKYALAKLNFHYGEKTIAAHSLAKTTFTRDKNLEQKYIRQLKSLNLNPVPPHIEYIHPELRSCFLIANIKDETNLHKFNTESIALLTKLGWEIEVDADYFPIATPLNIDSWYGNIEGSGIDWFSFELGVIIKDKRINLLPALIAYIKQIGPQQLFEKQAAPEKIMLEIAKNQFLPIPYSRVEPILKILYELYSPKEQHPDHSLKISRAKASLLIEIEHAFASSQLRWFGGQTLLNLGKKLQNFSGIKSAKIPTTFNAILRPYQQEGVNWLQFLREYQLNGILADDMGLGKTIQALAHLAIEKHQKRLTKPCLIVAPTSVITNWQLETQRFLPSLKVLVLHGKDRLEHYTELNHYDLIITTYPLITRDKIQLLKQDFYLIILDEAQFIKNIHAKVTQIVQQLKADYRLCLTGTPLENHLGELWSIFHFLMPGLLGSIRVFNQRYRIPIEKHQDQDAHARLTRLIKPFLLRRTKPEVIADLPKKTEIINTIELEGEQRDLYESIRLSLHEKVVRAIQAKGIERSQIIILDALLKLRQICCDPRLLKLDSTKHITQSAKLKFLMEILPEMLDEGRRIIIFSQFTSMLALIEAELNAHNIKFVKLTGQTQHRKAIIDRFQNLEVPVFLISLKAGGTGLNLTAADTIIHYDPWWNPAVENQATDRAHRIGQTKAVFVYKLITHGTVEEKILMMQERKRGIAEQLFAAKKQGSNITREDLEALFK